jgi:hypothetical protein
LPVEQWMRRLVADRPKYVAESVAALDEYGIASMLDRSAVSGGALRRSDFRRVYSDLVLGRWLAGKRHVISGVHWPGAGQPA